MAVKIHFSYKSSIFKTLFSDFISLRSSVFFSACWIIIITFICTPRIRAESQTLLLSLATYSLIAMESLQSHLNDHIYQIECYKHLGNYCLEVPYLIHFEYHSSCSYTNFLTVIIDDHCIVLFNIKGYIQT